MFDLSLVPALWMGISDGGVMAPEQAHPKWGFDRGRNCYGQEIQNFFLDEAGGAPLGKGFLLNFAVRNVNFVSFTINNISRLHTLQTVIIQCIATLTSRDPILPVHHHRNRPDE